MKKRVGILVGIIALIGIIYGIIQLQGGGIGNLADQLTGQDSSLTPEEREYLEEQQNVEDDILAAIEAITTPSEENIRLTFGDQAYELMQNTEVDPKDVYTAVFGSAECVVWDVSITGDRASAQVTLKNKDLMSGLDAFYDDAADWAASDEALETLSASGQEGLQSKMLTLLVEALNNDELEVRGSKANVSLEKDADGNWVVTDPDAIINTLTNGLDTSSLI